MVTYGSWPLTIFNNKGPFLGACKKRTPHGPRTPKIKPFISSFYLQYMNLLLMSHCKLVNFVHLYYANHAKDSTLVFKVTFSAKLRDPFRDPSC